MSKMIFGGTYRLSSLRRIEWTLLAFFFLILPKFALAQAPQLVIPQPVFKFGEVAQGGIVEHSFKLKNAGNAPLKIRKIHPACGCTAVVLDSDTLAAGGETSIKTSFNTAGFQGYKVKTIRLYTDDPEQTSAVLTIQGTVRPDVEISPPRLHFGNIRRGQAEELSVNVLLDPASAVKITEIVSRSDEISVSSADVTEDGRSGKSVTVKLQPVKKLGSYRSRVEVKTTSAKNPVVNIPIFAYVEGDVRIEPNSLSFGLIDGPLEEPVEATAKLIFGKDTGDTIVSAKSNNPSLVVEHSPLDEVGAHMIKVRIKKNSSGVIRARVTITTNHSDPEQSKVSLPVYAIISRAGS